MTLTDLKRAARKLNAHQLDHGAGFYGSLIGGRYFQARIRKDTLQVSPDFGKRWVDVPADQVKFHDFNGRPILL